MHEGGTEGEREGVARREGQVRVREGQVRV